MTITTKIETLQRVAENNGWRFRQHYSGRGMYGASCVGIAGDNATDIIEAAAAAGITGARHDSLGLGVIVYWPRISLKEGDEE
jgi:hypothetical protein